MRDQFVPLVVKATQQFLNEQVNDRLKSALGGPGAYVSVSTEPADKPVEAPVPVVDEVRTTDEELEGFRIVRAIVCSEVSSDRVAARDAKTYFGILLDDNNRKPIARLWFNRSRKYLGVFDEQKVETRVPLERVEDIYAHAELLRRTVARYASPDQLVTVVER
ncbi:hypothetical protein ACFQV2_14190 [Actinokineospora soli]|uniref:Restriction endonuclease n=1 Tax=Actinokineospora soli TaxID=1048753 RepID=A0ABW2TM73_9PSEU